VLPSVFTLTGANQYLTNTDLLTADPAVTQQNGHQVVTYSLSPNAQWSDGTPIGVDDFSYLAQQAKQHSNAFLGVDYSVISSVAKGSDDRHVVVTFSRSDGDWRSLFSPLLPAHYMRTAGWDAGLANKIPVSAGPFRMSQTSASDITVVKDPNYFGTKAQLDKINFRVFADSSAAAAAIAAGELDAFYADPVTSIVPSGATAVDGGYYTQLSFNLRQKPLKNAAVRKAIAYALNRDAIAQAASPAAESNKVAANNLFATGSHGGTKNDGAYSTGDPAKARQLLTSAGYGSKPLSLRLYTTNSDPRRTAAAQLIARQLSAVGIRVTVIQQSPDAFFSVNLPQHNFDLALFGWSYSSTASSAADLYGCHGSRNYTGYCSSNFDRLTTQALGQPDLDQHNNLLNKADQQLWTDLPAIPLYQSKAFVAVSPNVHGATYNLGEFTLYWNTASWTKS